MEQLQRDESPPESGRERVKHRRERRASPSISSFAPGGGAQRALPGLRVQCRLRIGSPDKCAASPPGYSTALRAAPGGGAQRALPGLRVQCRLRAGSPDRCAASPPGNSPTLRDAPGGGAQRALPGLQVQCRLRAGSPDRCAASPPGSVSYASSVSTSVVHSATPCGISSSLKS